MFSAPQTSLDALREFAADEGSNWTSPLVQSRFYVAACRAQGIAPGDDFPCDRFSRALLEGEREEIVESIPWTDWKMPRPEMTAIYEGDRIGLIEPDGEWAHYDCAEDEMPWEDA